MRLKKQKGAAQWQPWHHDHYNAGRHQETCFDKRKTSRIVLVYFRDLVCDIFLFIISQKFSPQKCCLLVAICRPVFHWEFLFLIEMWFVASPSPKNWFLLIFVTQTYLRRRGLWGVFLWPKQFGIWHGHSDQILEIRKMFRARRVTLHGQTFMSRAEVSAKFSWHLQASSVVQNDPPKFLKFFPNLSLHVLWLKHQPFHLREFLGLGGSLLAIHRKRMPGWLDCGNKTIHAKATKTRGHCVLGAGIVLLLWDRPYLLFWETSGTLSMWVLDFWASGGKLTSIIEWFFVCSFEACCVLADTTSYDAENVCFQIVCCDHSSLVDNVVFEWKPFGQKYHVMNGSCW